jgi:hypothetical protein
MSNTSFTVRKFATATAAMALASNGVDKLDQSQVKVVGKWAMLAASGLIAATITLDDIKAAIIANYPNCETLADIRKAGFETVANRYFQLQVVANNNELQRILNGEALNTVSREIRARGKTADGEGKAKGKGKGKGKAAKTLTFAECVAGLTYHLDAAMANTDQCKALANNEALAALVAKIAAVSNLALNGVTVKRRRPVTPRGKSTIATLAAPASKAGNGRKKVA